MLCIQVMLLIIAGGWMFVIFVIFFEAEVFKFFSFGFSLAKRHPPTLPLYRAPFRQLTFWTKDDLKVQIWGGRGNSNRRRSSFCCVAELPVEPTPDQSRTRTWISSRRSTRSLRNLAAANEPRSCICVAVWRRKPARSPWRNSCDVKFCTTTPVSCCWGNSWCGWDVSTF